MSVLSSTELADFPASPSVGQTCFNTTLDGLYVYAPGSTGALVSGWLLISDGTVLRDSERVQDTLVRTVYAGRDYQTFLDEIFANIKKSFGDLFTDFSASQHAVAITKYLCAALDTLSWNMDSRATEANIAIAALRSSISREARALGYKPGAAVSSSVDMLITLTNGPYAFDVPIPAGFQFNGPNNLIFQQVNDVVIPAGQKTTTVVAPNGVGYTQGESRTESFTSSGKSLQRLKLQQVGSNNYVAKGSVVVIVNGTTWTEHNFLPFDAINVYEVTYDSDPPEVRFGDGVVGAVPTTGADIVVTYLATRGRVGNSVAKNLITTARSALTVNFQGIAVSGSNLVTSSGGEDPQSIATIRAAAPLVYSTADRCVSEPDWNNLINNYRDIGGAIAKGRATVIRGVSNELTIQGLLTSIKTAAASGSIPGGTFSLMSATHDAIAAQIVLLDTDLANLATANSTALTQSGLLTTQVSTAVAAQTTAQSELDLLKTDLQQLSYQENIGFTNGTLATFSAALSKIPVIPGTVSVVISPGTVAASGTVSGSSTDGIVNTVSITWTSAMVGALVKIKGFYRRVDAVLSSSSFRYSGPPLLLSTSDIVNVYDKSITGFDDGSGAITGSGISSGTINYTTGTISVTFSVVPAGSDSFGKAVVCSYQYKASKLQSLVDDAKTSVTAGTTAIQGVGTYNSAIASAIGNAETQRLAMVNVSSELKVQNLAFAAEINSANLISSSVDTQVDLLESYLDTCLSGECKANIVQVRALAHDANGNYTSPTTLLMNNLKTYLEDRKPITTTTSVVDGIGDLVAVNILIKLKIVKGKLYASVQPEVDKVIATLFKDRDYGVGITLSQLYGLIAPTNQQLTGVPGVESANITIQGTDNPSVVPNSDGDLVIPKEVVLIRGTITYQEIIGS